MDYQTWKQQFESFKRKLEDKNVEQVLVQLNSQYQHSSSEDSGLGEFLENIEDKDELLDSLDSLDKLFQAAWAIPRKREKLLALQESVRFHAVNSLSPLYDKDFLEVLTGLANWADNQLQDHSQYHLDKAANLILEKFGNYIPGTYASALREVFCKKDPNSGAKQYCYVEYQSDTWSERFNKIGIDETKAHEAKGMTIRWAGSEQGFDKDKVLRMQAPYSSVIEVSDTSYDTLVHEMLHWVTHDTYEKFTRKYRDQESNHDTQITREGTTEWLKRHARNNWEKGGYKDVFPVVDKAMRGNDKVLEPEDLMKAYFGGEGVEAVCQKLLESYHNSLQQDLERSKATLVVKYSAHTLLLNRIGMNRNWKKQETDLKNLARDILNDDIGLIRTQLNNSEAEKEVRRLKSELIK